jgi:hypothetical protein
LTVDVLALGEESVGSVEGAEGEGGEGEGEEEAER